MSNFQDEDNDAQVVDVVDDPVASHSNAPRIAGFHPATPMGPRFERQPLNCGDDCPSIALWQRFDLALCRAANLDAIDAHAASGPRRMPESSVGARVAEPLARSHLRAPRACPTARSR